MAVNVLIPYDLFTISRPAEPPDIPIVTSVTTKGKGIVEVHPVAGHKGPDGE